MAWIRRLYRPNMVIVAYITLIFGIIYFGVKHTREVRTRRRIIDDTSNYPQIIHDSGIISVRYDNHINNLNRFDMGLRNTIILKTKKEKDDKTPVFTNEYHTKRKKQNIGLSIFSRNQNTKFQPHKRNKKNNSKLKNGTFRLGSKLRERQNIGMINTSVVNKTERAALRKSMEEPSDSFTALPSVSNITDKNDVNDIGGKKTVWWLNDSDPFDPWARERRESLKTYNCSKGGNPYCLSSPIEVIFSPSCPNPPTPPIQLMFLISSTATHFKQRRAIRETWTLINDSTIQHVFLLALHPNVTQNELELEHQKHGDILLGNFVESYGNLTLKTIMGYEWYREHCPRVKFLMKTDDDMFISTNNLITFARKEIRDGAVMVGFCPEVPHHPRRSPVGHRWAVSLDQYPDKYYPQYCCGCGYIISGAVAKDVAFAMKWLPVLPLEDVFTGLAVNRLSYDVTILNRPEQFPSMGGYIRANADTVCKNLRNGTQLFVHSVSSYVNYRLSKMCL